MRVMVKVHPTHKPLQYIGLTWGKGEVDIVIEFNDKFLIGETKRKMLN